MEPEGGLGIRTPSPLPEAVACPAVGDATTFRGMGVPAFDVIAEEGVFHIDPLLPMGSSNEDDIEGAGHELGIRPVEEAADALGIVGEPGGEADDEIDMIAGTGSDDAHAADFISFIIVHAMLIADMGVADEFRCFPDELLHGGIGGLFRANESAR